MCVYICSYVYGMHVEVRRQFWVSSSIALYLRDSFLLNSVLIDLARLTPWLTICQLASLSAYPVSTPSVLGLQAHAAVPRFSPMLGIELRYLSLHGKYFTN